MIIINEAVISKVCYYLFYFFFHFVWMCKRYVGSTQHGLMKELKKTNDALKEFNNVNKKALDQFVNFSDQREELIRRKEELDSGEEAIKALIEVEKLTCFVLPISPHIILYVLSLFYLFIIFIFFYVC